MTTVPVDDAEVWAPFSFELQHPCLLGSGSVDDGVHVTDQDHQCVFNEAVVLSMVIFKYVLPEHREKVHNNVT